MPSRNLKLSKRRTLKIKKLKKRLTRNVRNTHINASTNSGLAKMRGGAAAAASRYTTPYQAHVEDCYTPGDSQLFSFGTPNEKFLSNENYVASTSYSDHAPIIYNFAKVRYPLLNNYMNIITWNVGQWGNFYSEKDNTYNHKFYLKRTEKKDEYQLRLQNIVNAMKILLDENKPTIGDNDPFLFCQELPFLSSFPQKDPNNLREYFKQLLNKNSLELLCDTSERYEFGLIVRAGGKSQNFNVLNKSVYENYEYPNGNKIFSDSKTLRRFEIYFYEFSGTTYYYVNIHASYTTEPVSIVNFLNRIVDIIQNYHYPGTEYIPGTKYKPVTIYIIGDYNYNIAAPALNQFIETAKSKTGKLLYNNNPLNLFANPYLKPKRIITNMFKLTTKYGSGFSLVDNSGTKSPCNIDCILKLDLEFVDN